MEPVLTINEIFHSIQGESTHTGRPCVFVRLTACDLRCSWCDTAHAFNQGERMTRAEVLTKATCGLSTGTCDAMLAAAVRSRAASSPVFGLLNA